MLQLHFHRLVVVAQKSLRSRGSTNAEFLLKVLSLRSFCWSEDVEKPIGSSLILPSATMLGVSSSRSTLIETSLTKKNPATAESSFSLYLPSPSGDSRSSSNFWEESLRLWYFELVTDCFRMDPVLQLSTLTTEWVRSCFYSDSGAWELGSG